MRHEGKCLLVSRSRFGWVLEVVRHLQQSSHHRYCRSRTCRLRGEPEPGLLLDEHSRRGLQLTPTWGIEGINCGNTCIEGDQGNCRDIRGDQRNCRDIRGDQGNFRDIRGDQGNCRDIRGGQGICRGIRGDQGIYRDIRGNQGICRDI